VHGTYKLNHTKWREKHKEQVHDLTDVPPVTTVNSKALPYALALPYSQSQHGFIQTPTTCHGGILCRPVYCAGLRSVNNRQWRKGKDALPDLKERFLRAPMIAGCKFFLDQELISYCYRYTHLLFFFAVVGATSFRKPWAPSFQTGSGWNLTGFCSIKYPSIDGVGFSFWRHTF